MTAEVVKLIEKFAKILAKIILYIACVFCILYGIYCGIMFFKDVTSKSYERGSISLENAIDMTSFKYSTQVIKFYESDDKANTFVAEIILLPVKNFDAVNNNYELVMNNVPQVTADFEAGKVSDKWLINYKDSDGSTILSANYKLTINFLTNRTALTLTTYDEHSARLFEQYVADYGLVIEIKKEG